MLGLGHEELFSPSQTLEASTVLKVLDLCSVSWHKLHFLYGNGNARQFHRFGVILFDNLVELSDVLSFELDVIPRDLFQLVDEVFAYILFSWLVLRLISGEALKGLFDVGDIYRL